MPAKRAILSELTRDELRDNLDFFELEVDDRRVTSQLIDALAGSRKARLDEILPYLSRSRLKELCRAFDLDDSGRRKADLAVRLLGPGAGSKSAGGTRSPSAPSPVIDAPDPPAETLSVAQLEQYLWSAADILRGSIDSNDYKTYIFGLLFLKRLSDRFEEEAEKLVADGVSEEVAWTDPDEHQFFVPDRARWGAIQKRATNIGETLNKACAALEEQNPRAGRRPRRHRLQRRAEARRRQEPRHRARAPGPALLAGLAAQRPHGRARPARPRLRWTPSGVPDRAVRRRRRQEGRRVLHAADGRQAHRRAAGADRGGWLHVPAPAGVRLNWRIIQVPMHLVDYVVVHELVHLRHRGHDRDYWQAVGRVMPDYERRREELRRCGRALTW